MPTKIATALAEGTAREAAAQLCSEVRSQLDGRAPVLIAAFSSTKQPLDEVCAELGRQFPDAIRIGASTAGGFTERGDEDGATALFALAGDYRVFAGIGRGLKTKDDLALVDALAASVKAEVACSRPVAEGLDWLGKDRYIGVSGAHISPDLYFAIGISGQLQHMVGVRGAKTIVAINTDANAPVFKEADYCLVGDLYALVPAITAALQ